MENFNYKTAWTTIKEAFPILNDSNQDFNIKINEGVFYSAINIIKTLQIGDSIQQLVVKKIEDSFRKEIAPKFWLYFYKTNDSTNNESNSAYQQFQEAVNYLYCRFTQLKLVMDHLTRMRQSLDMNKPIYNCTDMEQVLKLICRATLLSQLPTDHQNLINSYELALKMHDPENSLNSSSSASNQCLICLDNKYSCCCMENFNKLNRYLGEMDLLESLLGQPITDLVYTYIRSHIQKVCKDSYDTSHLENLEHWLQVVVIVWLRKIYSSICSSNFLNESEKRLTNYLYNTFTRIMIDQLFNIIIEYPESLPALEDLKLCLPKTDLKLHLTQTLQKAMETRLLHPGVSTSDVLTAYVATIRSLRILDPSGLLLETITQPVHQYLRSREDTVRCVVSSLTEEGPNDLAEELVRGEAVHIDENTPPDEDMANWETWTPDPVDGAPNKSPTTTAVTTLATTPSLSSSSSLSSSRRTCDIISMLVNVYGSKELFVNEYRTLLADRLLSQYSCDTEKEIRYLELLKLRFGDSQLHYCEVMLKDIADSKRINQNVKQDQNYTVEDGIPLSAMIVSAQFWPAFKDEKLELHRKLVQQVENYTKAFETLKGSRTLCWKNHLGIVDLEIELADRKLNLSVSPVHATILMHFQDYKTWTLDKLSKIMHVPSTILRRKISFWQSHGVIIESEPDVFALQEEQENKDSISHDIIVDDCESESVMASAQDQREEELQTFWSYIVGMLMNLDTLPLERIHQMLKMFAFQGPTIECSLQELRVFLDRKVKQHQLIYSNGLYRLPK